MGGRAVLGAGGWGLRWLPPQRRERGGHIRRGLFPLTGFESRPRHRGCPRGDELHLELVFAGAKGQEPTADGYLVVVVVVVAWPVYIRSVKYYRATSHVWKRKPYY